MLLKDYFLKEAGDGASVAARNAAMRDNVLAGQCSTFVHRASGWSFSLWPLNPLLFPLRLMEELTRMYSVMLESPYLKHYNWMVGSRGKVREMVRSGDWLLPPTLVALPPAPPPTMVASPPRGKLG